MDSSGPWAVVLAGITWVGAAAAGSAVLGLTLALPAAGATIAAVANLSLHGGLLMAAGWLLLIASAIASPGLFRCPRARRLDWEWTGARDARAPGRETCRGLNGYGL